MRAGVPILATRLEKWWKLQVASELLLQLSEYFWGHNICVRYMRTHSGAFTQEHRKRRACVMLRAHTQLVNQQQQAGRQTDRQTDRQTESKERERARAHTRHVWKSRDTTRATTTRAFSFEKQRERESARALSLSLCAHALSVEM